MARGETVTVAAQKSIAASTTTKAAKPIEAVASALEKMRPQIVTALAGSSLSADRLLRVVYTALSKTPDLLTANRTSLYAAVLTAAQLGLEPDGVLGMGYLIPFKGRVQFVPGYKGLVHLARNSGEVADIRARIVREGDDFVVAYGLEERLHHIPALRGDLGDPTHVYAVAKWKTGGHHFEVMTRDEVETIRKRAPGGNSDAWRDNWGEMAKKTALRRLAKFLPQSVQRATALDEQVELGHHANVNDLGDLVVDGEEIVEVPPAPPPTSALDEFAGLEGLEDREPGED